MENELGHEGGGDRGQQNAVTEMPAPALARVGPGAGGKIYNINLPETDPAKKVQDQKMSDLAE